MRQGSGPIMLELLSGSITDCAVLNKYALTFSEEEEAFPLMFPVNSLKI